MDIVLSGAGVHLYYHFRLKRQVKCNSRTLENQRVRHPSVSVPHVPAQTFRKVNASAQVFAKWIDMFFKA